MPEIRIGNLVRHKSGGPVMIVDGLRPPQWGGVPPYAECIWVEDNQRRCDRFHLEALQTVYADGSPRDYSAPE